MGRVVDPETGLIYLRARYYDPSTGQFLTRDPAVAVTGSAYGYVAGNPLNGADPTGLNWLSDTLSIAVTDPVGSFIQGWDSMSTTAKVADATLPITLPAAAAACWFACPVAVAAGGTAFTAASNWLNEYCPIVTDEFGAVGGDAGAARFARAVNLPADNPAVVNRAMKVTEFIAEFRDSGVRGRIPGEFLDQTVEDALRSGDSTVRKMLINNRFGK